MVRCSCRSARSSAAPFLSAVAELLVASDHHTVGTRAALCRIISTCPVPSTRAAAIGALASLALPTHKIGIANVARRDMDAAVRSTALASLANTRPTSEDEVHSSSSDSSW